MPLSLQKFAGVALTFLVIALPATAFAQNENESDLVVRIEQLEEQLRRITGQNEELQHRNRILEQQLQQFQAAAPAGSAPAVANAQPAAGAAVPPPGGYPPPAQPGGYVEPQIAAPAPIVQEEQGAPARGRRGDAFDPSQNPGAPGAPQPLGGGQMPMQAEAPVGAPGGRAAGEPLDLASTGARRNSSISTPVSQPGPATTGGLTTLPPSNSPRDEYDLGIGYIQRKDYALAEETMRNFIRKYPSDRLVAEAQYWLGESLFQRQRYRDAAESFLGVTTKFDTSAKAPDALLRLGQSLAALKEKEAACAALGEVARKYPRASAGVKQGVQREQKRNAC